MFCYVCFSIYCKGMLIWRRSMVVPSVCFRSVFSFGTVHQSALSWWSTVVWCAPPLCAQSLFLALLSFAYFVVVIIFFWTTNRISNTLQFNQRDPFVSWFHFQTVLNVSKRYWTNQKGILNDLVRFFEILGYVETVNFYRRGSGMKY